MKKILLLLAALPLALAAREIDMRPFGRLSTHKGATGTCSHRDGAFTVNKTNEDGFIIAGYPKTMPLQPGKVFEVSCDMKLDERRTALFQIHLHPLHARLATRRHEPD